MVKSKQNSRVSTRVKRLQAARSAALGAGRGGRRLLVGLRPIHLLGMILFTLLSVLPVTWGVRPLPYYLGFVANSDVVSRVDFVWQDPDEVSRELANIEKNFTRRYQQISEWTWVPSVSATIWNLLEEADRQNDPAALLTYAKGKDLTLTPAQAEIFAKGLQGDKDRIDPFSDLVSPMQRILRERVWRLGLMSTEDYRLELGKTIRIVDTELDRIRTARISRNDPLSPTEPAQLHSILDEGFARMPVSLEFRQALRDLLIERLRPSLIPDEGGSRRELEEQKERIQRQIQTVEAGRSVLLMNGQRVTPSILAKLREEEAKFRNLLGWRETALRLLGKVLLILVIAGSFILFLPRMSRRPVQRGRYAAVVALFTLLLIALAHGLIHYGLVVVPVPIGLLGGIAALLLGVPAALAAITGLCLILLVLFEGQVGMVLGLLGGGLLYTFLVPRVRRWSGFVSRALLCGLLSAALSFGWGMAVGEHLDPLEKGLAVLLEAHLLIRVWLHLVLWLGTGLLMLILVPIAERLFAITTDVRLHELQDQDHPLLRQLVMEAPGTYHHSVIVGTLAEAAAEGVGANPLLAKVGSYYHDIGKLMKPEYFAENESGMSRHDSLKPSMSALVITAHVKDGAEMARAAGLPERIVEIIEQHHGTGLVAFFYHRAKHQAADDERVEESTYRYPGPMTQSPEAALVMLADSVEAATRSLEDPTPAHIRTLVHELSMKRLLDRQLEGSGLTLSDLGRVEDAFVRVLTSMFHSRVKYPGQAKEGERRRR